MSAVELATAYVAIVPSARGIGAAIATELAPVEAAAAATGTSSGKSLGASLFGAVKGETQSALSPGGAIGSIASALGPGGIIAGAAVLGGAAVFSAASDIDEALDTITVKTGATGKAADGLAASFRNIASSTPSSFSDIASTMSDVYARTGLTGSALEGLTTQVLDFNRTTKDSPINVKDLTQALAGFGVPAGDMGKALDNLFRVSQNTGVPLTDLVGTLNSAGPVARQFGFSVDTTAGLLAQLNKAGIDSGAVMPGLRKAFVEFAKEGKEPAEGLRETLGQMDALIKAGDVAGARNLAVQLFGARGAGLVDAALQGKLSLKELGETFKTTGPGIAATAKSTDDFGESLKVLENNGKLALGAIGKPLFAAASQGMKELVPVAKEVGQAIGDFMKWGEKSGAFAALGKAIGFSFGLIKDIVTSAFHVLKGLFDFVDDLIHGRWGELWDDFVNILKGVWEGLPGKIAGWIGAVGGFLLSKGGELIGNLLSGLVDALPSIGQFFLELPGKIIGWLGDFAAFLITKGAELLGGLITGFVQKAPEVAAWLGGLAANVLTWIGDTTLTLLGKGVDFIAGVLSGLIQKVPEVASWMAALPGNVLAWIGDTLSTLLPKGVDFIAGVIIGLIQKAVDLASWMAALPGNVLAWIGETAGTLLPKGVDFIAGLLLGIIQKAAEVITWLSGFPVRMVEAIGDVGGELFNAGVDFLEGLWEGLKSKAASLLSWAEGFASDLVDSITNPLGIWSPSRVMREVGRFTMQGLEIGLAETALAPVRVMHDTADAILGASRPLEHYTAPLPAAPAPVATGWRGPQSITVPVYIGDEKIDEKVVRIQDARDRTVLARSHARRRR